MVTFCLNFLHSFRMGNKLKSYEKICKTDDTCGVWMLFQKDSILLFNQYMRSAKSLCVNYADFE